MDGEPVQVNDYIARVFARQMIDEFSQDSSTAWKPATQDEIESSLRPVYYNDERLAGFASGGINTRYDLACRLATLAEDDDLIARLDYVPMSSRASRR